MTPHGWTWDFIGRAKQNGWITDHGRLARKMGLIQD
jgi:hypothetical protein